MVKKKKKQYKCFKWLLSKIQLIVEYGLNLWLEIWPNLQICTKADFDYNLLTHFICQLKSMKKYIFNKPEIACCPLQESHMCVCGIKVSVRCWKQWGSLSRSLSLSVSCGPPFDPLGLLPLIGDDDRGADVMREDLPVALGRGAGGWALASVEVRVDLFPSVVVIVR